MRTVFEGGVVRLFPGFARWRTTEVARSMGRVLAVEEMLFDAGKSMASADLLAGFWREDAAGMDWLEDFLCDPATEQLVLDLLAPPVEEEPEESLYTKSYLVTMGTEMSDR